MASDIKVIWNDDLAKGDIAYQNGDLIREEGLETAVMISLFTDRRANEDDPVDDINDLRGWWGDQLTENEEDQIGSRLWLLNRAKTTAETYVKAREYILEALQWMINDEVAVKIDINITKTGELPNYILGAILKIYKVDGTIEVIKFDNLWIAQVPL